MPVTRSNLIPWVVDALNALRGSGNPNDVCRIIWENHQNEIIASDEMAYKWQYEVRWAKQKLKDEGTILPPNESPKGVWVLRDD